MHISLLLRVVLLPVIILVAPCAMAQPDTCTTNYCISSQSIASQTPPGWPAVPVETCCQTRWGALPDGIDWNNGTPVMICTSRAEYVTTFPNCGDPKNLSPFLWITRGRSSQLASPGRIPRTIGTRCKAFLSWTGPMGPAARIP